MAAVSVSQGENTSVLSSYLVVPTNIRNCLLHPDRRKHLTLGGTTLQNVLIKLKGHFLRTKSFFRHDSKSWGHMPPVVLLSPGCNASDRIKEQ